MCVCGRVTFPKDESDGSLASCQKKPGLGSRVDLFGATERSRQSRVGTQPAESEVDETKKTHTHTHRHCLYKAGDARLRVREKPGRVKGSTKSPT